MHDSKPRPLLTALLLLTSLAWLGLIFLAPLLRGQGSWTAEILYLLFGKVCHQLPERSLHWLGEPVAVCHRCLGIYVGFAAGLALLPAWRALTRFLLANPRRVAFFLVPMVLDVVLGNTPESRLLTGFAAAFPVALFVKVAAAQILDGRTGSVPATPGESTVRLRSHFTVGRGSA